MRLPGYQKRADKAKHCKWSTQGAIVLFGYFFYGKKFVGLFLSTTGIALGNPLIASKMKFVSLLKLLWPQVIELSTQYLLLS